MQFIKKFINNCNKITAGIIVCICTIVTVYFLFSIYFMNHMYFGSKINGIDVSGKTVDEIKSQMESDLNKYSLNIKEMDGKHEQIKAENINLKYEYDEQFKNIKDQQNPFKWPLSFFNKSLNMTAKISYDKSLLTKQIDNLSCLNEKNVIEPKEPSFKYSDNNTFTIVNEVKGNKIDKDVLVKRIKDAVSKQEAEVDLQASNCYIVPKYTSKSENVIKARDTLNKYLSSKITYNFGNNQETLNGSTINEWLSVDDKFNPAVNQDKVKEYVNSLSDSYNTVGKARSFHTSSGNTINVSGGDYGWKINADKEVQDLIAAIKEGQTVTKKPAYSNSALVYGTSDIGNTYVEIDMTKQHLWFYKNGSLVVEGDVVTGNVSLNHTTPPGVYKLKYKERNATLKGEDYSTPVSFWMPFNGGIGIHDATWRSVFGGQIYKTDGSHGCVNSPYNLAQTIFNNIDVGTPVVCYY